MPFNNPLRLGFPSFPWARSGHVPSPSYLTRLQLRPCSSCPQDPSFSVQDGVHNKVQQVTHLHTALKPAAEDLPGQSHAPTPPLHLNTVLPSQHPTLRMRAYNKQWATTTDQRVLKWNALGQKPMVLWLGCSDSRIPESTLCGTQPGQVFVHRNIANTFQRSDRSAMAVLTYAVQNLGVEHVVVVGHTSCGGIAAGLNLARQALRTAKSATSPSGGPDAEATPDPSGPGMLLDYLQPLQRLAQTQLERGGPLFGNSAPALEARRLRELVRLHALQQAENIKGTDVVRDAVKSTKGRLTVDAWVYDVATGLLSDASNPDF